MEIEKERERERERGEEGAGGGNRSSICTRSMTLVCLCSFIYSSPPPAEPVNSSYDAVLILRVALVLAIDF